MQRYAKTAVYTEGLYGSSVKRYFRIYFTVKDSPPFFFVIDGLFLGYSSAIQTFDYKLVQLQRQ